jgi:uncharacterized Zn finger protein (UPF0148 family)
MTNFGVVTCPKCNIRVLPKQDGTCPNCQTILSPTESVIKQKSSITAPGVRPNSDKSSIVKNPPHSIGMTTNDESKNHRVKKTKYIESKYMRLKIVHKDVSNIADGTMGRTWRERKVKFVWNITRPETSMETFSTTCPDCGEGLKINVTSTAEFKSQIKKARTNTIALMTVSLIFGLGIYIFNRVDNLVLLILCLVGCVFCFLFGLIESGTNGGIPWGVVGTGSLISGEDLDQKTAGPHNCHYIETIESLRT